MKTLLKLDAAQVVIAGQTVGTISGTLGVLLDELLEVPGVTFVANGGATQSMLAAEAPRVDAGGIDVGLAEGALVRWDGDQFAGYGHFEMYKGDDGIIRLHTDEKSGRTNVRVRLTPAELDRLVLVDDLRSGREGVKVSISQADVDAGRVYVPEQEEEFVHDDTNVIATIGAAAVGQSISLAGDLASGFGEVVKIVPRQSVSVRVQDETTGQRKRIKLSTADLRAGKLAAYAGA